MRTFFKLYSLPIMVVVIGLGLYAGVVFVMKDQDLILAKNSRPAQKQPVERPITQAPQTTGGLDSEISESSSAQGDTSHQVASNQPSESSSEPFIIAQNDTKDNKDSGAKDTDESAQAPHDTAAHDVAAQAGTDSEKDHGQDTAQLASNTTEPSGQNFFTQPTPTQPTPATPLEPASSAQPTQSAQPTHTSSAQAPSYAAKGEYRYAKHRINIRQAPSSEANVISRAVVGEALELLGVEGDWSRVKSSYGVQGYVASRLLAASPTQGEGEPYIVLPTALNVRLKPDSESAIIGRLSHNMRIGVIEAGDGWGKIQLPNKQYGYVSLEHVRKASGNEP